MRDREGGRQARRGRKGMRGREENSDAHIHMRRYQNLLTLTSPPSKHFVSLFSSPPGLSRLGDRKAQALAREQEGSGKGLSSLSLDDGVMVEGSRASQRFLLVKI